MLKPRGRRREGRTPVATYLWTTKRNYGQWPPTGALPVWNTPSGIPKAVVRNASPIGAGDVLVRTRVSGFIGVYGVDTLWYPFAAASQRWQLLGEVGSSSSLPPDPTLTGTNDFAFSFDMDPIYTVVPFSIPTAGYSWTLRATTYGVQESRAERGPASYGGVHPNFNLGIVQNGDSYFDPTAHSIQSFWGFTVRCLWRVP